MWDVGFRMWDFGFRISEVGCGISDVGFRISDFGGSTVTSLIAVMSISVLFLATFALDIAFYFF